MSGRSVLVLCLVLAALALVGVSECRAVEELTPGVAVGDTLTGVGDVRYYYICVNDSTPLIVMLRGSATYSNYSLIVHEGSISGTSVGAAYSANNDYSREVCAPTPGQCYYVEVKNLSSGSRSFTLTADLRAPVTITSEQQLDSQPLWGIGDVRYYKIQATISYPMLAMMKGSNSWDYYTFVVREGNPCTGTSVGASYHANNDWTREVCPATAGQWYYIAVRNAQSGARTFSLRADIRIPAMVMDGQQLDAQPLWAKGDVRYYKIQASDASPLLAMLRGANTWDYYNVSVRVGDACSGAVVGTDYYANNDWTREICSPTAGGWYYICVRNDESGARTFSLRTEFRPPVTVTDGQQLDAQSFWAKGDVRYYRIQANAIGSPIVAMTKGSSNWDYYAITMRDGMCSGTSVGADYRANNEWTREFCSPAADQWYYICVRNDDPGTRTFSLRTEFRPPVTVTDGQQLDAQSLWVIGDVRYYKIQATDSSPIVAMTKGSSNWDYYAITMRDSMCSGTSVGADYRANNEWTREFCSPTAEQWYYIVVRNDDPGSRTFTLRTEAHPVTTLVPGLKVDNQSLWAIGDVRYYKVWVTCSLWMSGLMYGSSTHDYYDFRIKAGNPCTGASVGAFSGSSHDASVQIMSPTADTPYFIQVRNDSPGGRTFSVWSDMDRMKISSAKKKANNGPINCSTSIIVAAPVTFVSGDEFYVESDDLSCGIQVRKAGHGLSVGQRVDIQGTLREDLTTGERYIEAGTLIVNGAGTVPPVGLSTKGIGGTDWLYNVATGAGQRGVKFGVGLSTIGLLVKTWGTVTDVGDGCFYIADGWPLVDAGEGVIKVVGPVPVDPPSSFIGKSVQVTGISSSYKLDPAPDADLFPQILATDVQVIGE